MRKLKVLSLFDGISGARLALGSLGIPVDYTASEIDPDCLRVAGVHYPDNRQAGDVTKLDPTGMKVDLLIGGSPCQNLSKANGGDTSGFNGAKSRLFFEFVRLKEALKPKWWLLENVASMSPDCRQVASVYLGAAPRLLDAALVSAQSRKRLYWTNLPEVPVTAPSTIVLADCLAFLPSGCLSYFVPPSLSLVYNELSPGQYWKHLPDDHPEKLRILATRTKHASPGGMTGFWRLWDTQEKSPTVTASGIRQRMTRFVFRDPATGRVRYPTPAECERLQGLPASWTYCLPTDARRYKAIGNGFSIPSLTHLLQPLL